jgi:hypothetical protein
MSYDSKTGTINSGPESDFLAHSGAHFVNALRRLSQDSTTPPQVKSDWKILEDWLGCIGRAPTDGDNERIRKAWCAYFAIGVAPSHELQPVFDSFSDKHKASGQPYTSDKPPENVMDVFDRLLASDADIKKKQADDIAAEKKKFAKLLDNLPGRPKTSWWRKQSPSFRLWAFASIVWAAAATFYIILFDPFELGDWR